MKGLLLMVVTVAWAAPARAEDGMLPPDAVAIVAIDASPMVRSFDHRRDAAGHRSEQLRIGEHEFTFNGMARRRDFDDASAVTEWEVGMTRALRLPGKRHIDRMLGSQTVEIADLQLADARHQAALQLLADWFAWLRAEAGLRLALAQESNLGTEREGMQRRVAAGDAAQLELLQVESALAMARAETAQRTLDRDQRRRALQLAFPDLPLPERVPLDGEPADLFAEQSGTDWVALILERSHEIGAARAIAERAHYSARRARADRIADPTVGLQTLSDRGGEEQAIGITFSWPLGGSYRRATAAEREAEARVQDFEQVIVEREVRIMAEQVVGAARAAHDGWEQARIAAEASAASNAGMERAYRMGETDLAQLLLARRMHGDAMAQLEAARLSAHESRMRVLIDAHERWIADGHQDGTHGVGHGTPP